MRWFWKRTRSPKVKTDFGVFRFDETGWISIPVGKGIVFQICDEEFDVGLVDRVGSVMEQIDAFTRKAVNYATAHGYAELQRELILEAIDITELLKDKWGMTFGINSKPDFTVSVEFSAGEPCEVWGAD